jgi:hypothetical protein
VTIAPPIPYVLLLPNSDALGKQAARRRSLAGTAGIVEFSNVQRGARRRIGTAVLLTQPGTSGWNRQPGCICRIWAAALVTSINAISRRMTTKPRSRGCMPAAAPRQVVPPLRQFEGAGRRLGAMGEAMSLLGLAQFGGEELRLGRLAHGGACQRRPRHPGCAMRRWPGTSRTSRRERRREGNRRLWTRLRHLVNALRHCAGGSPPALGLAATAGAPTAAARATPRRLPPDSGRRGCMGPQRRRRQPLPGTLIVPRTLHQLVAT